MSSAEKARSKTTTTTTPLDHLLRRRRLQVSRTSHKVSFSEVLLSTYTLKRRHLYYNLDIQRYTVGADFSVTLSEQARAAFTSSKLFLNSDTTLPGKREKKQHQTRIINMLHRRQSSALVLGLLALLGPPAVTQAQRRPPPEFRDHDMPLNNIDSVSWPSDAATSLPPPIDNNKKKKLKSSSEYHNELMQRKLAMGSHVMGAKRRQKNQKKPLLITCKEDHDEEDCKRALEAAGATIVHAIPKSPFFGIQIDIQAGEGLKHLPQIEMVEEDPIRTLSRLNEPTDRSLQQQGRQNPSYGVNMVRAREVWNTYADKGGNAKVCVIDTGIHQSHEDFVRRNLSGSTSEDVIRTWVSCWCLLIVGFDVDFSQIH